VISVIAYLHEMLFAQQKCLRGLALFAWVAVVVSLVGSLRSNRYWCAQSFILPSSPSCRSLVASSSSSSTETVPTLSDTTTWRMRIVLRNVQTEQGTRIPNEMFVITGQFREDEGYEPPQGTFVPQTVVDSSLSATRFMRITQSRWKLSEDPNDRKDGLWVWGLFKEPLYPYMLFSFETLPILWNEATNDFIPSLQLYVQLNHTRNRDTGAVSLSSNTLYDLKIRQMETIAADPLGVSKVDVYEELTVGTFSIQPI
jgi:hypothetical protein